MKNNFFGNPGDRIWVQGGGLCTIVSTPQRYGSWVGCRYRDSAGEEYYAYRELTDTTWVSELAIDNQTMDLIRPRTLLS